ncbi:alpha/beta fold hydrolase [Eubacterium ramulus]
MSKQKNGRRLKRAGLISLAVIAALVVVSLGYVSNYYHLQDRQVALQSTADVTVEEVDYGYFFDGPGNDTALIFYPGAKVEDLAYANLLKQLAAEGIDCYLVHMPGNLAFLGMNRADKIMETYSYDHWYLAGHSLGGAMAAVYADKNSEKLDGLIFLAAYSTKDLSATDLKVLSVYGSNDGVVNMDKVVDGRKLMPSAYEEFCIQGGNHAGYGDYGAQKGDGEADISALEQQEETAEKIVEFCE